MRCCFVFASKTFPAYCHDAVVAYDERCFEKTHRFSLNLISLSTFIYIFIFIFEELTFTDKRETYTHTHTHRRKKTQLAFRKKTFISRVFLNITHTHTQVRVFFFLTNKKEKESHTFFLKKEKKV